MQALYSQLPSYLTSQPLLTLSHPRTSNMSSGDAAAASTSIAVGDTATDAKGVAPSAPTARVAPATRFAAIFRKTKGSGGWKRGLALVDFLLRIAAAGAALAAAIGMATSDETLPFFTQLFQFHASYSNFPPLTFFVIGNAIAAGYLLLSLPFSLVGIIRPRAVGLRLLLLVFDVVMVALTTAAASSAAAIVYLAHEGNSSANWAAICLRFKGFCQQTSGAVVASFVAVVIFMLLVEMSALALRKH